MDELTSDEVISLALIQYITQSVIEGLYPETKGTDEVKKITR
jgi:hypothetical protein